MSDEPHCDHADSPTSSGNHPDSDPELGGDAINVTADAENQEEIIPGDTPILENRMVGITSETFSYYYQPGSASRLASSQRQMGVALQQASTDLLPDEASASQMNSDIETCDEENYHFVSSATTGRVLSDVQSDIVTYEKTPQHFNSTVIGGIAMLSFEFTNWSVRKLKIRVKSCKEPFSVDPQSVKLSSGGATEGFTILFQPKEFEHYSDVIVFEVEETKKELIVEVVGECCA